MQNVAWRISKNRPLPGLHPCPFVILSAKLLPSREEIFVPPFSLSSRGTSGERAAERGCLHLPAINFPASFSVAVFPLRVHLWLAQVVLKLSSPFWDFSPLRFYWDLGFGVWD